MKGDSNVDPNPSLEDMVPVDVKKSLRRTGVVTKVVDFADFLEVQAGYAPNIVVGFARVNGRTVGVIANQPSVRAGVLDIDCSNKAARFIRFCNAFNIPCSPLSSSGLPSRSAAGAWRNHPAWGQDAIRLFGGNRSQSDGDSAQVLWRSISGDVRQGPGRGPRFRLADGGNRGDGSGRRGGNCLPQGDQEAGADKTSKRKELIERYRDAFSNPYVAAGRRLVDAVIEPSTTRRHLAQVLEYLHTKRELRPAKKHGLMPL